MRGRHLWAGNLGPRLAARAANFGIPSFDWPRKKSGTNENPTINANPNSWSRSFTTALFPERVASGGRAALVALQPTESFTAPPPVNFSLVLVLYSEGVIVVKRRSIREATQ